MNQSGIPDTKGEAMSSATSWKSFAQAFSSIRDFSKRLFEEVPKEYSDTIHKAEQVKRQRNYSNFTESIGNIRGSLGTSLESRLGPKIDAFLRGAADSGGAQIENSILASLIRSLQQDVGREAASSSGAEKPLLNRLSEMLNKAAHTAGESGLNAMGGESRDAIKAAFSFQENKSIDNALQRLNDSINNTSAAISNSGLKDSLRDIRDAMNSAAQAASTSAEKQKAVAEAAEKLKGAAAGATGADKGVMEGLSVSAEKTNDLLSKGLTRQRAEARGAYWGSLSSGVAHALGTSLRVALPIKKVLDAGNAIFQQVNSTVNRYARLGIEASSERGAYGRVMRGAEMNFSNMMSAIGTGRRAGMEDRDVVDRMATLQEKLARSRWGEGTLIEDLGKWGLTPFDASGKMKDFHQVMIDISNKFNTLGDDMERLQFISMQGFSPDQMEYVKNFARDARRWEEIKNNPQMQGVLESAKILDESGMSARIDAATKIELRRRQILNQNAQEEGVFSGIMRGLHPENWLFNDWTARQQGLKTARSEKAMDDLTRELNRVREVVKENKGATSALSKQIEGIDSIGLENLALTGGWAEADIANRGAKSSVHDLRALYAQTMGLENLDSVQQRNKWYNLGVGAAGGAGIGASIAGILGLVASIGLAPVTGGLSLAGIPAALALGAGIGGIAGGAIGYTNPMFDIADDGSGEHIERLRQLSKAGDKKGVNQYVQKHHLWGITDDIIRSEEFQDNKRAAKILQGAFVQDRLISAQALTDKAMDVQLALGFNKDKYYQANKRAAEDLGKTVTQQELEEAMARSGTGDMSIGLSNKTAYNYLTYGYDQNSQENQLAIRREKRKLAEAPQNAGKSEEELQRMAEEKVEKDFYSKISREDYQKAKEYYKNEETGFKEKTEAAAREEYKQLMAKYTSTSTSAEEMAGIFKKLNKYAHYQHEGSMLETPLEDAFSEEEFVRNKTADLLKNKYIDPRIKMFGYGDEAFKFKDDKAQTEAISQYLSQKPMDQAERIPISAKIARFARRNGVSEDLVRSRLFKEEELDEIESKLEKGEEVDAETKARYQEYKQSSSYKSRQEKKKAEVKEKTAKREQKRIELAGLQAMQNAGIELSKEDQERMSQLSKELGGAAAEGGALSPEISAGKVDRAKAKRVELTEEDQKNLNKFHAFHSAEMGMDTKEKRAEKWKAEGISEDEIARREQDIAATENWMQGFQNRVGNFEAKQVYDKETGKTSFEVMASPEKSSPKAVQYAIKMAAARGNINLEEKFSKEDLAKYRKAEAKRKAAFVKQGIGTEGAYEDFKAIENAVLRGEQVSDEDLQYYNETKERLEVAQKSYKPKKFKPLNQEEPETAEEAEIRRTVLKQAKEAKAQGLRRNKKGNLNRLSDMREISEMKKKRMSDAEIRQRKGSTRLQEYKEGVSAGEYEDYDRKYAEADEEAAKKRKERHMANYRARLDATPMKEAQKEALMKEEEEKYDKQEQKRTKKRKARQAQLEAENLDKGSIIDSEGKKVRPGFEEEEKTPTGEAGQEIVSMMQEKANGVAQAVDKMAISGEATEKAAASAKEAMGGNTSIDKSVTLNVSSPQITQNIQGEYPLDANGMKQGTMQGVDQIVEQCVQKVIDAFVSVTSNKGTY